MDLQRRGLVHDDVVVCLVEDGEVGVMRAQHGAALAAKVDDANWCLASNSFQASDASCLSLAKIPSPRAMSSFGGW
jgi:hypothetical protein